VRWPAEFEAASMTAEKLTPRQFELFRDFIYRHSGIRVEIAKVTLVSNRIRRRLRAHGLADFDAYYRLLSSPSGVSELEGFLDAVTTNETHFFRTAHHFDWFKDEFVADLLAREKAGRHAKSIRVWSAACASGEEPYSLAICLLENSLRLRGWKLSVLGSDISEAALRDARQAVFKQRSLEEVSPARLKRHFEAARDGQSWTLRKDARALVEFQRHNLTEPLRQPPFDCVFIRNVLIYFDRESKQRVIENLVRSLERGGYLVVGPSEGIYDMLGALTKRSTFLYQKP
jgi:chemotaxis protein methyltransferase CheR